MALLECLCFLFGPFKIICTYRDRDHETQAPYALSSVIIESIRKHFLQPSEPSEPSETLEPLISLQISESPKPLVPL